MFRLLTASITWSVISFACDCAAADVHRVLDAQDISAVLSDLSPGDTVVMENGTWSNQNIDFGARGTKEKPVTLRAQTPGMVVLNGNSRLSISGEWVVVDGLRFDGGALQSGSVVQFRGKLGHAKNCRFTNSSIVNYNPADAATRYFWVSMYGQFNRVDHCYFRNQNHSGVTVCVWRDTPEPDFHRIENNHFADRPAGTGNGFETIRIGTSDESESDSSSIISSNLFERTNGEMEIISNKSGNNRFQFNTFSACAGTLTLRHGHGNVVEGNFFLGRGRKGTGGVRVIGEDQIIVNNYFSGLDGRADGAIAITAGIPNSPLNGYSQVKGAVIAHGTIADIKDAAIVFSQGLSSGRRTLLANRVTIANNIVFSKHDPLFKGQAGTSWTWKGNIAFGQSLGSAEGLDGITVTDPLLRSDEQSILRPSASSPAVDSAVGDFREIAGHDMDGQKRSPVFDIGADELSADEIPRGPLTGRDVGPSLCIRLSRNGIEESGARNSVTALIVRNKEISGSLIATITDRTSGRIMMPRTVTFPRDQSSVSFDIKPVDDNIKGITEQIRLTVSAAGYPQGSAALVLNDHD